MVEAFQFPNDIVGLHHGADIMPFVQHIHGEEIQIIRANEFMINFIFNLSIHLVFSLKSINSFDLSLFCYEMVETSHTVLIVPVQLFLENGSYLWSWIFLIEDLIQHLV